MQCNASEKTPQRKRSSTLQKGVAKKKGKKTSARKVNVCSAYFDSHLKHRALHRVNRTAKHVLRFGFVIHCPRQPRRWKKLEVPRPTSVTEYKICARCDSNLLGGWGLLYLTPHLGGLSSETPRLNMGLLPLIAVRLDSLPLPLPSSSSFIGNRL